METPRRGAAAAPEAHEAPPSGLTTRQRIIAALMLSGLMGGLVAAMAGPKDGAVTAGGVLISLIVARNL